MKLLASEYVSLCDRALVCKQSSQLQMRQVYQQVRLYSVTLQLTASIGGDSVAEEIRDLPSINVELFSLRIRALFTLSQKHWDFFPEVSWIPIKEVLLKSNL